MSYLAPLNSDDAFKKVFGEPKIAKAFLEDFLDIRIEDIELIEKYHKVTNAASLVKFDFRCRIKGQYVVIEMQQANKTDVIKRFYIYHCLNTCLQLEKIKDMIVTDTKGKEHRVRNYNELDPVFTIIWMVTDTFAFKEDFVEYSHFPKAIADFIKGDFLWQQEKTDLVKIRTDLVKLLNKNQRGLDFLPQNRMIYAFQQNIVANQANKPYLKWFEFAEKTRDADNQVMDFESYLDNSIFIQIMERLATISIESSDLLKEMGEEAYYAAKKLGEEVMARHHRETIYWEIYEELGVKYEDRINAAREEVLKKYEKAYKDGRKRVLQAEEFSAAAVQKAAKVEEKLAKAEQKAAKVEEKLKALLEKQKQEKKAAAKAEREKAKARLEKEEALKRERAKAKLEKARLEEALQMQLKIVRKMFDNGNSVETIADFLEVPIAQIQTWIKNLKP